MEFEYNLLIADAGENPDIDRMDPILITEMDDLLSNVRCDIRKLKKLLNSLMRTTPSYCKVNKEKEEQITQLEELLESMDYMESGLSSIIEVNID
jgi:hypothetical protein